jgi:predicted HTH transcriptional regulator
VISDDDLAEYLALNHEQRSVEFKPPGPLSDKYLFACVARACLAMTNRRDGGLVLVGVDDSSPSRSAGLTEADAATWLNYDDLSDKLGSYSDPPIQFECAALTAPNTAKIVVIEVLEFEDIPTICKKDYNDGKKPVLEKGALYLRSHHKPETTSRPSHSEMRELLDLAVEKGVRSFIERARRVGIDLHAPSVRPAGDVQRFNEQLGELA